MRLFFLHGVLLPYAIWLAAPCAAAEPLRVFVSIPPQQEFVEKIGGQGVEVEVMLPPGESPETYSPSPRLMARLAGASIYFEIGVPFERSWTGSIRSRHPGITIVSCCDHITGGNGAAGHADHDPHIWSDPLKVRRHAADIRDALAAADPGNAGYYAENYRAYAAALDELDRDIRQALAGRRTDFLLVSHAAWGHYAERYGLTEVSLEKNGKEAGPRSLGGVIDIARREGLDVLFAVGQYKSPFLLTLADEIGARLVEVDPLAGDYIAGMRRFTAAVAAAVR